LPTHNGRVNNIDGFGLRILEIFVHFGAPYLNAHIKRQKTLETIVYCGHNCSQRMLGGSMKIASVKEVKDNLSQYLRTAEKEDVIITKNGRPNAVLHHLDDDDIEHYILEQDPEFRAKIEKRWNAYLRIGGRSIEDALQKLKD
jgi:prevent-host-death family protein